MKFKLDENLPIEAAERMRIHGHDAVSVHDQGMNGAADDQLAQVCQAEGRGILTLDLDFANLQLYPPGSYPGIVVFRMPRQDRESVLDLVEKVIPVLDSEPLAGRLWVVDAERVRIRE